MRPRRVRRHRCPGVTARIGIALACALGCALTARAAPQYERTGHYDAALTSLGRAVVPVGTGQHHALLVSLRSLRDPQLKPLFDALVHSPDFTTRMHGILGIAELTDAGVDPALVASLGTTADRSTALRSAISLRLVPPQTAIELLKLPDLSALDRAALSAELFRMGKPIDPEVVRPALSDPSDEVAGLGAMLMLQAGDRGPWSAFVDRLMTRPAEIRNAVAGELGKAALTYRLVAAVPPLLALASRDGFAVPTRMAVNAAALSLDRDAGIAAWRDIIATDRAQSTLMRAGLQMLAHEGAVPTEVVLSLRNGDALIQAIIDAIVSCSGTDPDAAAASLEALIATGNRQAMEWAMRRGSMLPPKAAARVLAAMFAACARPDAVAPVRMMSLDAATRLAKAEPSAVVALLKGAAIDETAREILLLGMLSAMSDEPVLAESPDFTAQAIEAAKAARVGATRRAESLALLLQARVSPEIDQETLRALGIVAAGGGAIDPTLQVQAAWLFIRHSGRGNDALTQLRKS